MLTGREYNLVKMGESYNIGFIGTSWITRRIHIPCAGSHSAARLWAVCGRDEHRANEVAKEFETKQVYTDWRTLLDDPKLDIVVIGTPDDLHYPMALAALDRGLHVICERPLATNSDLAYEMYATSVKHRLRTMSYLPWRWFPPMCQVKELITAGYVGKPHYFFSEMGIANHHRNGDYHWTFDKGRANGVIGTVGSDCIDCAQWMMGDIARIAASERIVSHYRPRGGRKFKQAGDAAAMVVEFDTGAHGALYVTANASELTLRIQVEGCDGAIEMLYRPFSGLFELRARGHGDRRFTNVTPFRAFTRHHRRGGKFEEFVRRFVQNESFGERLFLDNLINDDSMSPSFLDGLRIQEVMDAAMQSTESGCSEKVVSRMAEAGHEMGVT